MSARHSEIMNILNSDGAGAGDNSSLAASLRELAPVASLNEKMYALIEERESMEDLLAEADDVGDHDMKKECKSEVARIDEEMKSIGELLVDAVLPKDEDDHGTDAVLEVRAGTGGDEVRWNVLFRPG